MSLNFSLLKFTGSQSNKICSVLYRHPNSDLDSLCQYPTKVLEKLSNERKYGILMGDFNIILTCSYKTIVQKAKVLTCLTMDNNLLNHG